MLIQGYSKIQNKSSNAFRLASWSPDLSPCDYFFWGYYVKKILCTNYRYHRSSYNKTPPPPKNNAESITEDVHGMN